MQTKTRDILQSIIEAFLKNLRLGQSVSKTVEFFLATLTLETHRKSLPSGPRCKMISQKSNACYKAYSQ